MRGLHPAVVVVGSWCRPPRRQRQRWGRRAAACTRRLAWRGPPGRCLRVGSAPWARGERPGPPRGALRCSCPAPPACAPPPWSARAGAAARCRRTSCTVASTHPVALQAAPLAAAAAVRARRQPTSTTTTGARRPGLWPAPCSGRQEALEPAVLTHLPQLWEHPQPPASTLPAGHRCQRRNPPSAQRPRRPWQRPALPGVTPAAPAPRHRCPSRGPRRCSGRRQGALEAGRPPFARRRPRPTPCRAAVVAAAHPPACMAARPAAPARRPASPRRVTGLPTVSLLTSPRSTRPHGRGTSCTITTYSSARAASRFRCPLQRHQLLSCRALSRRLHCRGRATARISMRAGVCRTSIIVISSSMM